MLTSLSILMLPITALLGSSIAAPTGNLAKRCDDVCNPTLLGDAFSDIIQADFTKNSWQPWHNTTEGGFFDSIQLATASTMFPRPPSWHIYANYPSQGAPVYTIELKNPDANPNHTKYCASSNTTSSYGNNIYAEPCVSDLSEITQQWSIECSNCGSDGSGASCSFINKSNGWAATAVQNIDAPYGEAVIMAPFQGRNFTYGGSGQDWEIGNLYIE